MEFLEWMGLDVRKEFWEMFLAAIQLGAVLAVALLYRKRLWPFRNKKPRHRNVTKIEKAAGLLCRFVKIDKMVMWLKIMVSCLPSLLTGLLLTDFVEENLHNWFIMSVLLIVCGVLFLLVEDYNEGREIKIHTIAEISWIDGLLIGGFQALALIAGTSRFGTALLGGILIGASRKTAAEYALFLAIPVVSATSLFQMAKIGFSFSAGEIFLLLVGTAASFLLSAFLIRFLMRYIKKHDFKAFGWCQIVLGVVVILFFTFLR